MVEAPAEPEPIEIVALPQSLVPPPVCRSVDASLAPNDPRWERHALDEVDPADFDLPVVIDDSVARWVERIHHGGYLERGLRRARSYVPSIHATLAERGLPGDLAVLPLVESEFNPLARSSTGAAGLWQIVPTTGRHLGLQVSSGIDDRVRVSTSTAAAAELLSSLRDKFDGDWRLALAAYNAGSGAVRRAMAATGATSFDELYARRALPASAREYVPKVTATLIVARYGHRYGLPAELPARDDLDGVAELRGVCDDDDA